MAGPWIWDGPAAWPRSPPAWDGSDFPSGISQRVADQDLVLNERLLMPGGTLAPLICLPARHRPEDFSPCYKHFTSYYISEVLPGLTANLSTPVFHSSFFSLNPVPPRSRQSSPPPPLPPQQDAAARVQGGDGLDFAMVGLPGSVGRACWGTSPSTLQRAPSLSAARASPGMP